MNELPPDPYVCPFCGYTPPSQTLKGRNSHLGSCETYDRALEELAADRGVSIKRVQQTHENTDAIAQSWYALKSERTAQLEGVTSRVRDWLGRYLDAPDQFENETQRDGLLSSAPEWHAITIGIGAGIIVATNPQYIEVYAALLATIFGAERVGKVIPQISDNLLSQLRDETHYFVGGSLLGYLAVRYLHGMPLFGDLPSLVDGAVNATATLV